MRKKEFHIIDQMLIIGSTEVNTTMKQITICICHDFQEQMMKRIQMLPSTGKISNKIESSFL